jgi:choline monooxygenase
VYGFEGGLMNYSHNPDLSFASTIQSDTYHSSEFLKKDYQKIFPKMWSLLGRKDLLKKPGDYITSKIGLENIVVVVNEKEKIQGFVNVCRHRAGPIAVGSGNSKILRCLYHSWTYDLDGKLSAAPEFQEVKDFNKDECALPPVAIETWGPFVFGALNPKITFQEWIGRIPEEVAYLNLEDMKFFTSKTYTVQANWKVYVDNFLEGYHLPSVHPDLCKELDYKNYVVNTFRWYSNQDSPPRVSAQLYAGSERPGAHYYWMFPNLMFNIYQGMLQTNIVIPTGPDTCAVQFDWYLRGDSFDEIAKKMPELIRFSDQIQDEDAFICAKVHENLKSATYTSGRYSVKRENGVHHFHSLIAEMYND